MEKKDKQILKAFIPPSSHKVVNRIFKFIISHTHLSKMSGGMTSVIMGLDKEAMVSTAKNVFGLELARFLDELSIFEDKLLQQQSERLKGSK